MTAVPPGGMNRSAWAPPWPPAAESGSVSTSCQAVASQTRAWWVGGGSLGNDQSLREPWVRDIWKFREGRFGGISPDVLCFPRISDGVLLGLGLWRGFLSLSDHVSPWLSPPTIS